MRHYEIVFLVHPDQSDQTQSVLNKFSNIVTDSGGKIHRLENVGRRKLAYPIQDQFKASYALLNIECSKEALEEIKSSFKFNDSIIRNLILATNKAEKDLSSLSKQTEEETDGFKTEETIKDPDIKIAKQDPETKDISEQKDESTISKDVEK